MGHKATVQFCAFALLIAMGGVARADDFKSVTCETGAIRVTHDGRVVFCSAVPPKGGTHAFAIPLDQYYPACKPKSTPVYDADDILRGIITCINDKAKKYAKKVDAVGRLALQSIAPECVKGTSVVQDQQLKVATVEWNGKKVACLDNSAGKVPVDPSGALLASAVKDYLEKKQWEYEMTSAPCPYTKEAASKANPTIEGILKKFGFEPASCRVFLVEILQGRALNQLIETEKMFQMSADYWKSADPVVLGKKADLDGYLGEVGDAIKVLKTWQGKMKTPIGARKLLTVIEEVQEALGVPATLKSKVEKKAKKWSKSVKASSAWAASFTKVMSHIDLSGFLNVCRENMEASAESSIKKTGSFVTKCISGFMKGLMCAIPDTLATVGTFLKKAYKASIDNWKVCTWYGPLSVACGASYVVIASGKKVAKCIKAIDDGWAVFKALTELFGKAVCETVGQFVLYALIAGAGGVGLLYPPLLEKTVPLIMALPPKMLLALTVAPRFQLLNEWVKTIRKKYGFENLSPEEFSKLEAKIAAAGGLEKLLPANLKHYEKAFVEHALKYADGKVAMGADSLSRNIARDILIMKECKDLGD